MVKHVEVTSQHGGFNTHIVGINEWTMDMGLGFTQKWCIPTEKPLDSGVLTNSNDLFYARLFTQNAEWAFTNNHGCSDVHWQPDSSTVFAATMCWFANVGYSWGENMGIILEMKPP